METDGVSSSAPSEKRLSLSILTRLPPLFPFSHAFPALPGPLPVDVGPTVKGTKCGAGLVPIEQGLKYILLVLPATLSFGH